jgi:hypothetical protein
LLIWPQLRPIAEVVTVDSKARFMADENRMGDSAAPIQITEYSDFQCPFCDRFHSDTLPLLEQYYVDTGKVLFTYRSAGNFVSDNSGAASTGVARQPQPIMHGSSAFKCTMRCSPTTRCGNQGSFSSRA